MLLSWEKEKEKNKVKEENRLEVDGDANVLISGLGGVGAQLDAYTRFQSIK